MKIPNAIAFFSFATILFLNSENLAASQTNPLPGKAGPKPKNAAPANKLNYNFHEATTLSGITLQPLKSSGTVLLKFDQQLTEPGTLQVKNNAGKILFTNFLQPEKERITRSMNIGKLIPGIYTVEVKTAATTFWKKVRIRN